MSMPAAANDAAAVASSEAQSSTTPELTDTPRPTCSRVHSNSNQTTLKSFIARPASVARPKRFTDMLLKMIIVDFQPFSVVEDVGFREFVSGLDPSFAIPTRHMLSHELLPTKYNQAVDSVKNILAKTSAVHC